MAVQRVGYRGGRRLHSFLISSTIAMMPRWIVVGRDDHALINSVSCRLSVLGCATGGAHNGAPRSQGSVFPAFFVTGRGFESPRLHLSWFAEISEISGKFPPTEDLGLPALPEALFCFCPFPAASCNFMCALWCALLSAMYGCAHACTGIMRAKS